MLTKLKNYFIWTLCLLLVIGSISLWAYFRMAIFGITFQNSLYQILSMGINEVWKTVSTPTIFIALMIFASLWFARKYLRVVFTSLTEIKAFDFSAKLDPSKLSIIEGVQKEVILEVHKQSFKGTLSPELLHFVVISLTKKFSQFLLDHDGELFTIYELSTTLLGDFNEELSYKTHKEILKLPKEMGELIGIIENLSYIQGFYAGISNIPNGIFTLNVIKKDGKNEQDDGKIKLIVTPEAKILLQNRLSVKTSMNFEGGKE